ncbi:thiamine-phosphate pyrophosphorylase [Tenacibaculum sp. MAR_2009_124]|uniref:thiamine phosphate synthase n=1 Tax=Tenacibaculum sp. MAR_2009_124 TaxID=1250059 RepID=UPI000899D3DF|nr:thiamine phosphate synthase [Tenacibaculum sp. MAR_2009_124]SEB79867.1 thiamine-phosphate pyrophosphorylase [Tenacibaculum sp. MAR_2009_124]
MIILIAPEKDVENEIEILHQLFEAGLTNYHLRKPFKGYEEHSEYLKAIDKKYHNRIVVHYFHELLNEFNLKGVHLQEQPRVDLKVHLQEYVESFKCKGKSVSSSFHEPEILHNCSVNFDYHLLSPVFSSISKSGYKGKGFDVNHINRTIIGMGGINHSTIERTLELGFKGVGVLGGVWNAENPIESFQKIKNVFEMSVSS